MARTKRGNNGNTAILPYKKQWLAAVNHLCYELYPRYISNQNNYGFIRDVLNEKKVLYP